MINIDDRLLDQLNEAQMWLLIHIVKRINADGECWPSTRTIQQDTKWSDVKKVRRVRDELVSMGVLEASERTRDDGGQTSNVYRINTEYIGVYVSAKRLQNLTRGEGKNLTRGVGKNLPRGEGKNNTPLNEVLTIEPTLSLRENENPTPSVEESTWVSNSETRYQKALSEIAAYLRENPTRWGEIANEGRAKLDKAAFFAEVKAWLRWNADNWPVIQFPVKALTSGKSNFIGWLAGSKEKQRSAPRPAPQPDGKTYKYFQKQER